MKNQKSLIVILLLSVFLIVSKKNFAQDKNNTCSYTKIKYAKKLIKASPQKYKTKSSFQYDLKYHRLELLFENLNNSYIKGCITSYFKPTSANFTNIAFDLTDNMIIDSVIYHGTRIFNLTLNNDELLISFQQILQEGLIDSVSVYYKGVPSSDGFGSFTQSEHDGVPIIWTLSEPYGAKDWWPCKQDLNDKIDSIDVYVTNPADYKAASNGLLISEEINGGMKTAHWKHRHPIAAYLIAVAVTNYSAYSDNVVLTTGENVEVLNYVFPENLSNAQASTPNVLDVIQLYSNLFIPYPFYDEKYGHAQFGWGGGMEHQTMSFMAGFSHHLMAHELAHQWFGDYVTCGSWQDIWLNESFATYLDGMTIENGLAPAGETFTDWKGEKISSAVAYPDGSVWVDDTTSVSRIFSGRLSYNKGAMVLNMLRKKIGDEAFFGGLKDYLNDPELANGYARTVDLQNHLETACGYSLQGFLDDWFTGQGYPTYTISYSQDASNELSVLISQTQSHPSVDFFELDVPVKFVGTSKDTTIYFDNVVNNEQFTVNLDFHVNSAVFNPENDIIAGTASVIASVKQFEADDKFKILQNPVSDIITILCFNGLSVDEVSVYNIYGSKVKSFNRFSNASKIELDVSELNYGLYFLKIETNKKVFTRKIIKQ